MNAEKMRVGLDAECCSCGATPIVIEFKVQIRQESVDYLKLICPNGCSTSQGICLENNTRYEAVGLAIEDWNANPVVNIKLTPKQFHTFKEKGGNAWLTIFLDSLEEN